MIIHHEGYGKHLIVQANYIPLKEIAFYYYHNCAGVFIGPSTVAIWRIKYKNL